MNALIPLLLALVFASTALADDWSKASATAKWSPELDRLVDRYKRYEHVYAILEKLRPNGVPAAVLFALHYRECDNDFTCSPAQGDSLAHRSYHVPKGRIPGKNPPYTFVEAAEDAYYTVDRLHLKDWSDRLNALAAIEGFNGNGYRRHGIKSPYLWSGTAIYSRGKFVSDGRFDPYAVDKQAGVVAILKRLQFRGIELSPPFMGD